MVRLSWNESREKAPKGEEGAITAVSDRGVYIRLRPIEQCDDSRTARQP